MCCCWQAKTAKNFFEKLMKKTNTITQMVDHRTMAAAAVAAKELTIIIIMAMF